MVKAMAGVRDVAMGVRNGIQESSWYHSYLLLPSIKFSPAQSPHQESGPLHSLQECNTRTLVEQAMVLTGEPSSIVETGIYHLLLPSPLQVSMSISQHFDRCGLAAWWGDLVLYPNGSEP